MASDGSSLTVASIHQISPSKLATLLSGSGDQTMTQSTSGDVTTLTTVKTDDAPPSNAAGPSDSTSIDAAFGSAKSIAVIDVRDDDHIGGHIQSSKHVPSRSIDERLPDLVEELRDVPTVVFHCALSQQRGPQAALKYMRERERVVGQEQDKVPDGEAGEHVQKGKDGRKKQEVYILEGGFVAWQEL
ncbi:MAG: hypothetical protein M1815_001680 [Lichina confinis]|nr:MAG: hypothetical protein M1815_001680 [Lichina confinis]